MRFEKHKEEFFKAVTEAKPEVKPIDCSHYISGKYTQSKSGETFENINPATREVLGTVQVGGKGKVDQAVIAELLPWLERSLFWLSGSGHIILFHFIGWNRPFAKKPVPTPRAVSCYSNRKDIDWKPG